MASHAFALYQLKAFPLLYGQGGTGFLPPEFIVPRLTGNQRTLKLGKCFHNATGLNLGIIKSLPEPVHIIGYRL